MVVEALKSNRYAWKNPSSIRTTEAMNTNKWPWVFRSVRYFLCRLQRHRGHTTTLKTLSLLQELRPDYCFLSNDNSYIYRGLNSIIKRVLALAVALDWYQMSWWFLGLTWLCKTNSSLVGAFVAFQIYLISTRLIQYAIFHFLNAFIIWHIDIQL